MKGITKDYENIRRKDYESLFYSMKDQCEKILALHPGNTFQFPSIGRASPAFMI